MYENGAEFPKIDFIGIGVNKAATTWIHQCLREHPDICMSKPKETGFFGSNCDIKKYAQYFKHCPKEKTRGEYTPAYLYNPSVAQEVKTHFPDVKLIVCLRNPIDRLVSEYNFQVSYGKIADTDIDEFLSKTLDTAEKNSHPGGLLKKGRYATYLKHWLEVFSRSQFLILLYEDIEKTPEKTARDIFSFLGVDQTFVPSIITKKVNVTTGSRTRFLWLNRFLLSCRARMKSGFFGEILTRILKTLGVNTLVKTVLKKNLRKKSSRATSAQKETPSPHIRARLQDFYKNEIAETEKILDRDLSSWQYI